MIKLRPYQEDIKAAVFTAWNSGFRNVLLVMPTGMGKTKTFCSIVIDTLNSHVTTILVHRKELVQQICLTLAEEGISHNIIASRKDIKGIIAAERRMFGKQFYNANSRVSVVSVDTLKSRKEIYKTWVLTVTQVITDEAAHVLKG
jgi:superfamily II DNA or RNA helicase